jgi:hypothetical protein
LRRSDRYHHVVAVKGDRISPQPLARIGFELAITELPIPVMPRAAHDALFNHHLAVTERRALMGTTIGDGIKFARNAENSDRAAARFDSDAFAFRDLVNFANDVFCHNNYFRTYVSPSASARMAVFQNSTLITNFDIAGFYA